MMHTEDSRMSTTSTIKAVDTFCEEYCPPSVALHRLSYLDKELPPPPPPETPTHSVHQSIVLSRTSTQKDAGAQTIISVQSRYSTRIKPSTPNTPRRLSIISSQHRDSEDHISIRSRFSTQDLPIENAAHRSEPCASIETERRRPSDVKDPIKKNTKRRNSGSISPRTLPNPEIIPADVGHEIQAHEPKEVRTDSGSISPGTAPNQELVQVAAGREIEILGLREAEVDPRTVQIVPRKPLTSTESQNVVPRRKSTRKASVGWTFHEGLILRADDNVKRSEGASVGNENLALRSRSKSMVPVRWTFHDGILYRANESLKNEDGTSEASPKRMIPIGWSFYDGLTIKSDGSVKAISKATGKSEEIVRGSKSKSMIPIGWTFHEGLIFATGGSVENALKSSDNRRDIEVEAQSKRLEITRASQDGPMLRTGSRVQDATETAPFNSEVATQPKSKRTVGWTFDDGLTVRNGAAVSPDNRQLATKTKSKRTVTWTFNDGLVIKTRTGTASNNRVNANGSKSRRTIGWSFQDGIMLRNDGGVPKRSSQSRGMVTSTKSKRIPVSWSFSDGLTIKQRSSSKRNGKGKGVDRNMHPSMPRSKSMQRRRITYSFWDGVRFRTIDGGSTRVSTQPQSKLAWSFNDGITRKTKDDASGQALTQPAPKRTYGWTFNDGIMIKAAIETETLSKAAPSIRRPRSIAPANSPSVQPTTKGLQNFPDENDFEIALKQPGTRTISISPNNGITSKPTLEPEEDLSMVASSSRGPRSIVPANSPAPLPLKNTSSKNHSAEQDFEFFPDQSQSKTDTLPKTTSSSRVPTSRFTAIPPLPRSTKRGIQDLSDEQDFASPLNASGTKSPEKKMIPSTPDIEPDPALAHGFDSSTLQVPSAVRRRGSSI